jgi:hypothetical protein
MTTATPARTAKTRRMPEPPLFDRFAARDLRVIGRTVPQRPAKPALPVFSDSR